MVQPPTPLRTLKGKHRLHEPLFSLLVVLSSYMFSMAVLLRREFEFSPDQAYRLHCAQFDYELCCPLDTPLKIAIKGMIPDEILLEFSEKTDFNAVGCTEYKQTLNTLSNIVSPIFVTFYEFYRPWLQAHMGNRSNWPKVWSFGWAVRNCASHGGKLAFKSSRDAVVWRSLSYNRSNNGKKIIGVDLSVADIIILMFDMNDELDRLGCPISLD